jgi:hypothetical protein
MIKLMPIAAFVAALALAPTAFAQSRGVACTRNVNAPFGPWS